MEVDELRERQLEEAVAVRDDERLAAEQRLGLLDAAAGVEDRRFARVADREPPPRAVTDVLLDEMPEVVQVDHHLLDAAGAQEREQ